MDTDAFLQAGGWQVVSECDLGTTARVLIVERAGQRWALKTSRPGFRTCIEQEYETLRHLNRMDMRRYVPAVGDLVKEIDGFWMEYLRDPTPEERARQDIPAHLGNALRTLHRQPLPVIAELPDDRPDVAQSVCRRLRLCFDTVMDKQRTWNGLAAQDREHLQLVRSRYESYVILLPELQATLPKTVSALTHGDLSGDNLMARQDGSLVLADWGDAGLTSPLTDVAYLRVHADWNELDTERFLATYFDADVAARQVAYPVIELLMRLYRYQTCVRSLLWLNDGDLDAVGHAYFLKQLAQL